MRALLKALDPLYQFESEAAHLVAIMFFELASFFVTIGWRRQPLWLQQCGQIDHRNGHSNT